MTIGVRKMKKAADLRNGELGITQEAEVSDNLRKENEKSGIFA